MAKSAASSASNPVNPVVNRFCDRASRIVGNNADHDFNVKMWSSCYDDAKTSKDTSPIEQLFYIAFMAIDKVWGSKPYSGYGDYELYVGPQERVGRYFVDFIVTMVPAKGKLPRKYPIIAVELDGHEFHDRDEGQRRYEKTRDRFLQKKNIKVFHYTGKEVTDNPFIPAAEVFGFMVNEDPENITSWLNECESMNGR